MRRHLSFKRMVSLAVVAMLAATACGTSEAELGAPDIAIDETVLPVVTTNSTTAESRPDPTPAESDPDPTMLAGAGEWVEVDVGSGFIDGPTPMVEHDGRLWLARGVFEGTGPITVTEIDGQDVADHEIDAAADYVTSMTMASTPLGLVLAASGSRDLRTRISVRSDDGEWTNAVVADRAIDPTDLLWVDDRLLLAGAERVGAPTVNTGEDAVVGVSDFAAVLFESDDGETWTEIDVSDIGVDPRRSTLGPMVVDGDRLLTTSQAADGDRARQEVFESVDGGRTWAPSGGDAIVPRRLGTSGGAPVGAGASGGEDDGGTSPGVVILRDGAWQPVDTGEATGPTQFSSAFLLGSGPVALFTIDISRPPEYCYDEQNDCGRSAPAIVLVRPDGTAAAIDTSEIGDGEYLSAFAAVIGDAGDIHLLVSVDERLVVTSWSASGGGVADVPVIPPFDISEPTGPLTISWGDEVSVGEVYRYPLYVHCGPDVLGEFGDRNWWIDGEPTAVYDDLTADYTLTVLGEIHVVGVDRIEYRVDDELVAAYVPRPHEFPGCD